MPLLTTTIGAYPKPDYVKAPDWFRSLMGPNTTDPTRDYTDFIRDAGAEVEETFVRATQEAVADQVEAGIDIPTDGEVRRDNYIHYHCRHLAGFDFENLTEKAMRTGAWTAEVPTIRGPVAAGAPFLADEWRIAQACTDRPVKMTVPGPLTITDSVADAYYHDKRAVGIALAEAINTEVRALADAGCRWIQIDEPLFARWPDEAVAYGIDNLERCFHNVSSDTTRAMHMCCGYPQKLDQEDYLKAERTAYFTLADGLEGGTIEAVSIEDAHQHNDLGLLEKFKRIKIIFGAVAIAKSRVEPVEEIVDRLEKALDHIDAHRLIAAPDCGLGMQTREAAIAKMTNLCLAAKAVG
jgi:5-methyltetrahydropteroyltriglutamate--homocysteine methyltransferase